MAFASSDVVAGADILASSLNNLRADLLAIRDASGELIAASKVWLDGGGDTYIIESAANVMSFYTGGTKRAWCDNNGFSVASGVQINFNASADSYIKNDAGSLVFYANGINSLTIMSTGMLYPINDVRLDPTMKLYFDGGSHTYLSAPTDHVLDLYLGGVLNAKFSEGSDAYLRTYDFATAKVQWSLAPYGTWNSYPVESPNLAILDALAFHYADHLIMFLQEDGNLFTDNGFTGFSPDIRKHATFKDKQNFTADDFLIWALEDANKPVKPYEGIPRKRKLNEIGKVHDSIFETTEEVQIECAKYSKDFSKIAIGIAKWAEQAELRLKALEARQ